MYSYSFEEDIISGLHYDSLLAGGQNCHLGKLINNHKNTIIYVICLRKAQHVVHQDRFLGTVESRKRGVHALFLNVLFGNGIGHARLDILAEILLSFNQYKCCRNTVIVFSTPKFLATGV